MIAAVLADGLATTRNLHDVWSWVVVISNGLAGAWALGAHWQPALRHRVLWWYTAAAQITVFVQAVLGAVMVGTYKVPMPDFHALYGFSAIIAVAIIYSYRTQMRHMLYLLYGGGGLVIMGLGIRAMYIGPG